MHNLSDVIIGSNVVKQVTSSNYTPNNQIRAGRTTSGVQPSVHNLIAADPQADFQSLDVAGALTAVSITAGTLVSSGAIEIPFIKALNGGSYAGSGSHYTLNGADAFSYIQEVSASGNQDASVSIMTMFQSTNGSAVPVTESTSQSIAAEAFNANFALGPVSIDSSALSDVESVRIDPGFNVVVHPRGSLTYPLKHTILTKDPSIEITFTDNDAMAGQGPLFEALTSAKVYFKKRVDGGTFVADGTAEHVSISFATGIKDVQSIGGSAGSETQPVLRLLGKQLSVSTATAIT